MNTNSLENRITELEKLCRVEIARCGHGSMMEYSYNGQIRLLKELIAEERNNIIVDARYILSNFTEEEFTDEQLLLFSKKLDSKMMDNNGDLEREAFDEMQEETVESEEEEKDLYGIAQLIKEGNYQFIGDDKYSYFLTVELEEDENEDLAFEEVARLVEEGFTSGYNPSWSIEL